MLNNQNENATIKVFSSPQFGEVRIIGTSDEPLSCLSDLCKILSLRQGDVKQRLNDGVVSTQPITDSLGRQQQANFVNEDGLYDVILDSRKPQARAFRKWVTSEVLPNIRKNGGYIVAQLNDTPEEIMARALVVAQATLEKREERMRQLEAEAEQQQKIIEQKDARINKLQPKADFADAAFKAEGKVDIGQAAKILGLPFGRNTLFKKLKEKGILFNRNEPKQRYIDAGYFELTQLPPIHRNSHPDLIVMKVICTQKGLAFINKLFGGSSEKAKLATIC